MAPQRERYDALPDRWFLASEIPWLTTQRAFAVCAGLYAKRWLERRAIPPGDPRNKGKGHLLWEWAKV